MVAIIGTLSGIAVPAFLKQRSKASVHSANMQARGLLSYCQVYLSDHGVLPDPANDEEFKRLAQYEGDDVIQWEAKIETNTCFAKITKSTLELDPEGEFSITSAGVVIAKPAKLQSS